MLKLFKENDIRIALGSIRTIVANSSYSDDYRYWDHGFESYSYTVVSALRKIRSHSDFASMGQ
jgi:hypothetical protein